MRDEKYTSIISKLKNPRFEHEWESLYRKIPETLWFDDVRYEVDAARHEHYNLNRARLVEQAKETIKPGNVDSFVEAVNSFSGETIGSFPDGKIAPFKLNMTPHHPSHGNTSFVVFGENGPRTLGEGYLVTLEQNGSALPNSATHKIFREAIDNAQRMLNGQLWASRPHHGESDVFLNSLHEANNREFAGELKNGVTALEEGVFVERGALSALTKLSAELPGVLESFVMSCGSVASKIR